jgi:hypothetical protein
MYINEMLYFTQVHIIKLSILAFYLRLFLGRILRYLIWATIAITIALIVIFNFLTALHCQPIAYCWRGWDKETEGHCLSLNALDGLTLHLVSSLMRGCLLFYSHN